MQLPNKKYNIRNDNEALELRNQIVDKLIPFLDEDTDIAMDLFLNYETYFNDTLIRQVDPIETMASWIYDLYLYCFLL